jgi:N-acyl-D-aspartate/D-glutamate deacylase
LTRQDAKDLPGNERRLIRKATGIETTIVNGEVLVERGEHTGGLPGRVFGNGNGSTLQAAA